MRGAYERAMRLSLLTALGVDAILAKIEPEAQRRAAKYCALPLAPDRPIHEAILDELRELALQGRPLPAWFERGIPDPEDPPEALLTGLGWVRYADLKDYVGSYGRGKSAASVGLDMAASADAFRRAAEGFAASARAFESVVDAVTRVIAQVERSCGPHTHTGRILAERERRRRWNKAVARLRRRGVIV